MIPGMPYDDLHLLAGLFAHNIKFDPELHGRTINTQGKKDTDMTHDTVDEIRARAERARLEAERLERTASQLEKWGEDDPLDDGNVILWTRVFRGREASFTYVALRVNGEYYVTGRSRPLSDRGTGGISWQTLIQEHLRHADEVWRVTEYEELIASA